MKHTLRKQLLARRLALSSSVVRAKSREMGVRLSALPPLKEATHVMMYLPIKNEPDLFPLLQEWLREGKHIYVPVSDFATGHIYCARLLDPDRELHRTEHGILEPSPRYMRRVDPSCLEVVLVPGIAFDERGHRIGYGKGFYDRFLSALPSKTVRIGMVYEQQLLPAIPTRPADVPVDWLVTERRVITPPD